MMDERRWHVVFLRWRIHWFMRYFTKRRGYDHIILMSAIGGGRWIYAEWALNGMAIKIVAEPMAERIFTTAHEVIVYDQIGWPAASPLRSLLPMTCIMFARQVLGLPPTWRFWQNAYSLRCELLNAGAEVVIEPPLQQRGLKP
jgi:hypothetical protein